MCGKRFQSKNRPEKLEQVIWSKYVHKRRTLKDLSEEYGRSINWVRSKIDKAKTIKKKIDPSGLVIVADATFFGRMTGYLIFRAPEIHKNLYVKSLNYESTLEYHLGRKTIEKQGFKIKAMVLDGRPGARNVFSDIPVQMCHFHQKQIIQRYLTLNPKLEASIELKEIAATVCNTTEEKFSQEVEIWHNKWKNFLKERTTNPITNRWFYTHKRVRSAYRSLKINLPYLFTYQKYPELNIPNTTNSLDGSFAHLKEKVKIHRGLIARKKNKMIEDLLNN